MTLEPCAMCAMALLHARGKRVVYGARDPKAGGAGSVIDVFGTPVLNHHTEVVGGVLAEVSAELLRSFFVERREQYRQRRAVPSASPPGDDAGTEEEPGAIPAGESLEIDNEPER